jgi:hypothetical protein
MTPGGGEFTADGAYDASAGFGVPKWIAQGLPQSLLPYLFVPFVYSAVVLPIAAGQTVTVTTAIQADSHFVMTDFSDDTRDGATGLIYQTNPPFTVQFQNQGSGSFLSDRALGWRSVVGSFGTSASGPAVSFVPLLLYANASFAAIIANLDPGNGYNVRLSYRGFKIFGVMRDASNVQPVTGQ